MLQILGLMVRFRSNNLRSQLQHCFNMAGFNQRKWMNTVALLLYIIAYNNSPMVMFSYDMHNCSKTNKIYHITYFLYLYGKNIQREDSSEFCKNMMCDFENWNSSVEIRSGTKLNSYLLHLEVRFYYNINKSLCIQFGVIKYVTRECTANHIWHI